MRSIRVLSRFTAVVVILLGAYLGVTLTQVTLASVTDEAHEAGAIVVLGAAQYDGTPSAALEARLDHAADLYETGIAPVVVVTGGRRPGDRFTEAKVGEHYLLRRGIPDEALRLEVGGLNSWESLAATARFLRREDITDVVLVSSAYHTYRLSEIAQEVGLEAVVSPSTSMSIWHPATARALLRETGAVALGRIIGYRRLTNVDRALRG